MLDIKNIYIYILIFVIIANVLLFIYNFIIDSSFKKSIDNIGGCNDGYVNGPFPQIAPPTSESYTFKINVPIKGNYVLNICASAIANAVEMIAIGIWINGVLTNYSLKAWDNTQQAHRTLVPISFKYTLNEGDNFIYLQHLNPSLTTPIPDSIATYSDKNDFASLNWIYLA